MENEPFFVTLGRLCQAIKQANYSDAHQQRALELFKIISEKINDVAAKNPEIHRELTF